jgi:hypothetical protein
MIVAVIGAGIVGLSLLNILLLTGITGAAGTGMVVRKITSTPNQASGVPQINQNIISQSSPPTISPSNK